MANVGIDVTINSSGAVSGGRTAVTSLNNIEKAADKTTKSTGSLNSVMNQAGFQIADLATQLQYGGNVMQAVGVQGGQLIQAINPLAGAAFTVAGIMGGVLAPALFESADATETLDKSIEALGNTITVGADGVATFTGQIERLSATNERAARAQIALAVNQTVDALNAANDIVSESIEGLDGWTSNLTNAAESLDILDETLNRTGLSTEELLTETDLYGTGLSTLAGYVSEVSSELGVSVDQSVALTRSFAAFQQNRTPETMQQLADTVNDVNEATGFTNRNLVEFAKVVNEGNINASQYSEVMRLLKSALGDLDTVVTSSTESFRRQQTSIISLSQEMLVLQQRAAGNEREAVILSAVFRSGAEAGSEYAKQVALLAGQNYDLSKAIRESSASVKEYDRDGQYIASLERQVGLIGESAREQAMLRAEYSLSEEATATQIEQARQLAGALYDAAEAKREQARQEREAKRESEQATEFSMGIVGDAAGLEALEQQRQTILAYQEQEIGDAQAHAAALLEIEKRTLAERASITASGLGSLLTLQRAYGDDSSGVYKTLLIAQKTATLYSVLLSSQEAIGKAWASAPFPANLPAVATATVETGALAATVQALTPSFATGGLAYGPGTGTSDSFTANLSNGEFVMPQRETMRNLGTLQAMRAGVDVGGRSAPNLQIINQTTGKVDSASVEWVDQDTVRAIIREDVPGILAAEVNDEYSQFNRANQSQYVTQRKF